MLYLKLMKIFTELCLKHMIGFHYKSILKVKDGGKYPVSLEMTFVPPHPFAFNMPDNHSIKGTSITDVYVKVVRFFNKFGIEFRN